MLIIVVGGIIKRFDNSNVDSIFWLGAFFTVKQLFFIGNQDFSKNKRDQGVIVMLMGLLAIIGIAVLTAALLLFAVYKLSEE